MTQDEMNEAAKQDLFNHMMREHGFPLLESEMTDIVELCKKIIQSKVIEQPTPSQSDNTGLLEEWLIENMPPATVIGDPKWWAKRIRNVLGYENANLSKPQPTSQDVGDGEGYKLVPERASSMMVSQGADILRDLQNNLARTRSLQDIVDMIYTRMIQAAPQ